MGCISKCFVFYILSSECDMTDINIVTLAGRVTRSEFSYTQGGTAKLAFCVVNNKSYKKGEQWEEKPCFIDCVVWGAYAESLKDKLAKGVSLVVVGRLTQDTWTDQQGQKKSKLYIMVDSVQTFGARQNPQNYQQQNYGQGVVQSAPIPPQVQQVTQAFGGEVVQQFSDETIPF